MDNHIPLTEDEVKLLNLTISDDEAMWVFMNTTLPSLKPSDLESVNKWRSATLNFLNTIRNQSYE